MSMSTLISSTKLTVTDMATRRQRTFRDLRREPKSLVGIYDIQEKYWLIFSNSSSQQWPGVQKTVFNKTKRVWEYPQDVFYDSRGVGFAVKECIFGEGRERAVRRVREVDACGELFGPKLVGKESLFVEDVNGSISFQKTFCIVQQLAQKMANSFNRRLLALPGANKALTPAIEFINCHVMILRGERDRTGRGILVEKMLDHTNYYKKWNNDAGHVAVSSQEEDQQLGEGPDGMFAIEDIPQAYSHFTYLASRRRFLVCDLQGVLNTDEKPPVFELTDPAIHYTKMTSRKYFGWTDMGEHGIEDFLETHTCSNLCRMLLKRWVNDPIGNDIIQYEEALTNKDQLHTKSILVKTDDNNVDPLGPKKSVCFEVPET